MNIHNMYRFKDDVAINHSEGTLYVSYVDALRMIEALKTFTKDIEHCRYSESKQRSIIINEDI